MYAIHIRTSTPAPDQEPVDIHEVAQELSGSGADHFLQHIYAPRTGKYGHSGVLYAVGESVQAVGDQVRVAVNKVLKGHRLTADVTYPIDLWCMGMCDATVWVREVPAGDAD